jgi:LuxR family maltose regulon positive regulatory protein
MVDMQPGMPQHWLAETKYHPPILREDIIPRQHLLNDLRSLLSSHPLTLLSAPAGYGKTTLLATLYSIPDLTLGWLSLDEEDNDPARFLTAFIATLQRLDPTYGVTAQSLLTSLPSPGAEAWRVMSVLINDVLETASNPFTLILDDLHQISEANIFAGLNYLLEHMPSNMHLVVSSRRDPPLALARMRARGQVAELRLAKLRFTDEEAMTFLNDRLGLDISPGDVNLLQSRTEGWAVGLRLLAGSLDQVTSPADRRNFIQNLAQIDSHIFDFLAEEVFSSQEPAVKDFLLKTAILPELTTALSKAVTERDDAGSMLDRIYRRNLFLVKRGIHAGHELSSDNSPQIPNPPNSQITYRYHDLFSEFLRYKLQQERPESIPDLHLRAARAQSDPSQAVVHYLAAERWVEAAEIIEQIGADMFTRGYLDTLTRWINTLPASVREGHPRLLHYLSNCAFWKGTWPDVEPLLERALQGFEDAGDEAGQGEVLANLATFGIVQADYERSGFLLDQALTYPTPPHIRVQSLLGRASLKMEWGDWEQAEQDFKAAMALIEQDGQLDLLHLVTFPFFDPGFAFLPGGLEHLERICRQARTLVGDQVSPLHLMVEEMTTTLLLFRGQLEAAIRSGERALALQERLGGHPFLGIEADLFLIVAHSALGDFDPIVPKLDSLFEGVELTSSPIVDTMDLLFGVGRVRWLQGRLEEANEIYNQMLTIEDPRRDVPAARMCRAWMWSLLEMAKGHYSEAERTLRQPEVLEQNDRRSTISGSTRLMLARLYLVQNQRDEALRELAPVLDYHEKLGIPFTILVEGQSIVPLLRLAIERGVHETYAAYLLDLLRATGEPRPVYVPKSGESLTPREVEVLRLVMAGHSNQAIAEQLFISVWTVKSHLTQIYRKMDASSRTQAIARAHQLGIA